MLLINTVEDEANPPELGTVERAMKKIHDARYVLIPYSDETHGHFTHYYAAVWKPYLISFMGSLGPSAAASAIAVTAVTDCPRGASIPQAGGSLSWASNLRG